MLSPEAAGLVGAVAGGLVGGLAVRRRERDQLARLLARIDQLEERCAGLVALQRADLVTAPPLLTWPELERGARPTGGAGVLIV